MCVFLGPCSSAHVCLGCSCAGGYRSSRWEELLPPQTRAAGNHSDPELSGRCVPGVRPLPKPMGWICPFLKNDYLDEVYFLQILTWVSSSNSARGRLHPNACVERPPVSSCEHRVPYRLSQQNAALRKKGPTVLCCILTECWCCVVNGSWQQSSLCAARPSPSQVYYMWFCQHFLPFLSEQPTELTA